MRNCIFYIFKGPLWCKIPSTNIIQPVSTVLEIRKVHHLLLMLAKTGIPGNQPLVMGDALIRISGPDHDHGKWHLPRKIRISWHTNQLILIRKFLWHKQLDCLLHVPVSKYWLLFNCWQQSTFANLLYVSVMFQGFLVLYVYAGMCADCFYFYNNQRRNLNATWKKFNICNLNKCAWMNTYFNINKLYFNPKRHDCTRHNFTPFSATLKKFHADVYRLSLTNWAWPCRWKM